MVPLALLIAITACIALLLFLGLYIASSRKSAQVSAGRLHQLGRTLELYSAAAGLLYRTTSLEELQEQFSGDEDQAGPTTLLLDKLLACRAAPYASTDLLGQIAVYAGDQDPARLPLLLRTIERESERLIEEREKLLEQTEQPGWGQIVWQQVRHIIPFLYAVILFFMLYWLLYLSAETLTHHRRDQTELILMWVRYVSISFSLLLLYPAIMGRQRPSSGTLLLRGLGGFIALLACVHFAGLMLSPYILTLQVLLFAAGFRLAGGKPRKMRPFVGHVRTTGKNYTLDSDKQSTAEEAQPSHDKS